MQRPSRRDRRTAVTATTNSESSPGAQRRAGPARAEGISLVELMLVVALIGIVTAAAVPQFLRAYNRSQQRGTMADMRLIAQGNGAYHIDAGSYCTQLEDLEPDYVLAVPPRDSWDNDFDYSGGPTYRLRSFGSDGAPGPDAPGEWTGDPYEVDLIVQDGDFTQAPASTE